MLNNEKVNKTLKDIRENSPLVHIIERILI